MRATGQRNFRNQHGTQLSCLSKACAHRLVGPCRLAITICYCLAASLLMLGTGCARFQLPAIDPNGSRIFLPFPATTQFTPPRLHSQPGQPGIIPNPAFTAPAMPPPCIDGSCETPGGVCNLFDKKHKLVSKVHDHFRSPGEKGEIVMTPKLVVAPVNGEVVLLAGICGEDGYLVTKQPLEWMLSPDSVGQFIEVGDDAPGKLASLTNLHTPKVEKLDVDFARGRTSNKETLITRGTPNCDDDIQLREGETWLSISSPSEGVSRVTVLAPDSDIWDRRRQTATIYWVDAQWEFPPPLIGNSGTVLPLVTRVTKAENLVPAEDWIVRYTIVDPNVATFAPATGNNVSLVRVNSDGQAAINVAAASGARGTTPILIDVIRPAQPSDNLPEIIVGRGQTMVTFSSPGLNLQTFGPEIGAPGEQLTYTATLGNPGDLDAENARLLVNIPAGTKFLQAVPQPSTLTNSAVVWDQGLLPAGRQIDVALTLEALQVNTFDVVFNAEAANGLSQQSAVRTEIVQATVETRFEPVDGIAEAEVGEVVRYEIDVKNTSRQALTDIKLLIETSPGLPELYQSTNRVEQTISYLQPGETRSVDVEFRVQQTGQQEASLRVSSGSAILSEKRSSVRGIEPRPKQANIGVGIQLQQSSMRQGATQLVRIKLANPGEVKLTNIQVELRWDPALQLTQVDQVNASRLRTNADRTSAVWEAQDLLPPIPNGGDMVREMQLEFRALAPITAAQISVLATAEQQVQAQQAASIQIIENEVQPPAAVAPPVGPREGRLSVELSDFGDPVAVNSQVRFGLRITNGSNQPDRNLQIRFEIPPGVRIEGLTENGSPINYRQDANGGLILPTINFMRPNEPIDYILVVVPTVPQRMIIRATVISEDEPQGVSATEDVTVQL